MEITLEEVNKAKQLIYDFSVQVAEKYVPKEYTCACCKTTKLKIIGFNADDETKHYVHPLQQEQASWWSNGDLIKFTCGYGSRYDMSTFFMAICDDCIEKLLAENIIISENDIAKALYIETESIVRLHDITEHK